VVHGGSAESALTREQSQLQQTDEAHAEMAAQVIGRLELLARLHVAALDIKESDMVVRQLGGGGDDELARKGGVAVGGRLDARLVDLDEEMWTYYAPTARMPCLHLMSLQLPTVTLVCGPMRHTPFARHFARGALHSTLDLPRLDETCLPPDGHFSHWRERFPQGARGTGPPSSPLAFAERENSTLAFHLEHPRSRLQMNAMYTGPMTGHNRAVYHYFDKTIGQTRGLANKYVANRSRTHGEAFRIHQMIYDNWQKTGNIDCPAGWSWNTTEL